MILSERAQFLIDNLDLPEASGVPDARWEFFQLSLWSDESTFRIDNKSRQIAWSFAAAADAVASVILEKRDGIFVSINKEESQEKIRYVNAIYDNLRIGGLPKRVRDSLSEIEFDNGARITSFPSRPVRGRPRPNLYFDEFAHVAQDKQIYAGSLPAISKGGRLRIGSSPLGASGMFWEIFEQKLRPYPGYNRRSTPWWEIYSFCTNVREARKVAPGLPTAERVERYGNERIRLIYGNLPEEDFQQEHETLFVDETTAWITWDEIRAAQLTPPECWTAKAKGRLTPEVFSAVDAVLKARSNNQIEHSFSCGVDIGRTRNATEIFAVGVSTTGQYPLRLMITLEDMEFDDQLSVLAYINQQLPVSAMLIDQNGIGRNLAENAKRQYPVRVQPVDFTNATKTQWATDAKMLIQQHRTPLPVDKELAYQIHSIKKMITGSRNLTFDTERNEKHHADKFWAWALALAGAYAHKKIARSTAV